MVTCDRKLRWGKLLLLYTVFTSVPQQDFNLKNGNSIYWIGYLVRQGLAIRGHAHEGNVVEHLKERSEDKLVLKAWLKHEQGKPTFIHSDVQNEIIQIMGHEVSTTVLENIKSSNPLVFTIICDGTRDITGDEQESICVR
ncbi:hypothetical protein PR048_005993 [Dryococelus australis]|uniref:DUF4371 domain-containing protein n=1 Tax=Dryococelus australis TaxID=614101 RepID=A0ABQ9I9Q8_9NEOP|nr:hypothetical protein PR048_005993 [Dryococelus australis]